MLEFFRSSYIKKAVPGRDTALYAARYSRHLGHFRTDLRYLFRSKGIIASSIPAASLGIEISTESSFIGTFSV